MTISFSYIFFNIYSDFEINLNDNQKEIDILPKHRELAEQNVYNIANNKLKGKLVVIKGMCSI